MSEVQFLPPPPPNLLLYLLAQKTRLGLAMRATSENVMAAQTLGMPTRVVLSISRGVVSALGVAAGIFLAPGALILDVPRASRARP